MTETIRTSGDLRRFLAQTMLDVRSGAVSIDKADKIANLAKEVTSSLQSEVNAAKTSMLLRKEGMSTMHVAHLGQMIIDSMPPLPEKVD
jgi:hypothetical protein